MTTVLVHRQRSPPSDRMAKVSEANTSALEAEQWKLGHQAVVPPGVEKDHHGVNHAKSLHAFGHDPQGPQADMPKKPPATVGLPAPDAASVELHSSSPPIWSLSANLT